MALQGHTHEWLQKLNEGTEMHTVDIGSASCVSELRQHAQTAATVLLKVCALAADSQSFNALNCHDCNYLIQLVCGLAIAAMMLL